MRWSTEDVPIPCPCGKAVEDSSCTCRGLRNHISCPAACQLPWDNEAEEPFYEENSSGMFCAARNWCLVGQVSQRMDFGRPRMLVRTRFGEDVQVHFYHDCGLQPTTFTWGELRPGSTVIIAFTQQHSFMDGSVGVRQEDLDTVFVLPASLDAVLRVSDALAAAAPSANGSTVLGAPAAQHSCWSCGKTRGSFDATAVSSSEPAALKTCSRCSLAKYCSQECQKNDWGHAGQHKQLCKHVGMLAKVVRWVQAPHREWELWK